MKKRICFLIFNLIILFLFCTSVPDKGIKQEKMSGYNRNNGCFLFREDAIYYIDKETRRSESQQKTITSINMAILPVKEPLPGVQIINCRYTVIEQGGERYSILSFHLSDEAGVFLDDYFELIKDGAIIKLPEKSKADKGNISFLNSYVYAVLPEEIDTWIQNINIDIEVHINTSKGKLHFILPMIFFKAINR